MTIIGVNWWIELAECCVSGAGAVASYHSADEKLIDPFVKGPCGTYPGLKACCSVTVASYSSWCLFSVCGGDAGSLNGRAGPLLHSSHRGFMSQGMAGIHSCRHSFTRLVTLKLCIAWWDQLSAPLLSLKSWYFWQTSLVQKLTVISELMELPSSLQNVFGFQLQPSPQRYILYSDILLFRGRFLCHITVANMSCVGTCPSPHSTCLCPCDIQSHIMYTVHGLSGMLTAS